LSGVIATPAASPATRIAPAVTGTTLSRIRAVGMRHRDLADDFATEIMNRSSRPG
jgi:hypothetical protein